MCDWEAEEYAEYLLWVGAEKARARALVRPVEIRAPKVDLGKLVLPLEPAQA